MNIENAKRISLIRGISSNDKGKLMWNESYEALQKFVEEALNIPNGVWSVPGGSAKQCLTEDIDLRWYEETKSITLNGKLKDEIREKLLSLSKIAVELTRQENDSEAIKDGHAENYTSEYSRLNEYSSLSLESLNEQLQALSKVVNANTAAVELFSQDSENERLRRDNVKLANENSDLKHENEKLKERIENLSYILADLNGKAKNAEDEKNSLITAMRILFDDNKGTAMTVNNDNHANYEIKRQSEVQIKQQSEVQCSKVLLSNRFSTLSDEVKEPNPTITSESTHQVHTLGKNKRKPKNKDRKSSNESNQNSLHNQTTEPVQQEDQQQVKRKTTVVVAGDSMLKYVKGWELSTGQQNVSVKSFSGATVDDMCDFLKPTLRKHPDKLIIHAGTNDIRKSDPGTVAHKVTDLAKKFRKDFSNTEVLISSLIVRNDSPELAQKVKQTNIILKSNCLSNNLVFLDNSNINCSHLNYRGLHLNRDGSALLQNNISNILKSND